MANFSKKIQYVFNKDAKNLDLLDSFVMYCQAHPQQRFWQALRNWSRVAYVYAGDNNLDATDYCEGGLVDTFYWGGKNG